MKAKLDKNRHSLLYSELLGLLHDIGKLSEGFCRIRLTWKGLAGGYDMDPHDRNFFKNKNGDLGLIDKYPSLKEFFFAKGSFPVSVKDAVDFHVEPKKSGFAGYALEILTLLKAADSVDSAQDRNNSLFSSGQTVGSVFDTDVFGAEDCGRLVDISSLEGKREALYDNLQSILSYYLDYFCPGDRRKALSAIKSAMHDMAFSDLNRPNNDTSLWEHSYAVASLLRAGCAHNIIYESDRITDFENFRFSILGIGWDGLRYLSEGHRIGDVIGRKEIIKTARERIKDIVEYEYLLGNCVYEDDNGAYFIVPAIKGFSFDDTATGRRGYEDLLLELQRKIHEDVNNSAYGDIYPHMYITPETRFMTTIVSCMREVRERASTPMGPLMGPGASFKADNTVCPLCRKRPVPAGRQKDGGICDRCGDIRVRPVKKIAKSGEGVYETPFISEITKASGTSKKACLIVARLGIGEWLSGRMIRSLFIKQANIFEREIGELTGIVDLKDKEKNVKDWLDKSGIHDFDDFDYKKLTDRINKCRIAGGSFDIETARNLMFLFDRRALLGADDDKVKKASGRWPGLIGAARSEYAGASAMSDLEILCNVLCAKTPTPSTVLDVWMSTEDYLTRLAATIEESLGSRTRLACTIKRPEGAKTGAAYEATMRTENDKQFAVDIVWLQDDIGDAWVVGEIDREALAAVTQIAFNDSALETRGDGIAKETIHAVGYRPFRAITATPDLFMAIVPADGAMEITDRINEEYFKRFGKVMGRLPLSVGHIFFREKTPMFVVLDSARRMINSFERDGEITATVSERSERDGKLALKIKGVRFSDGDKREAASVTWQLPFRLGTGAEDWHHPYFIVEAGGGTSGEKTHFKTAAGEVIHYAGIKEDSVIRLRPNLYDYLFLDSTARRYDIGSRSGTNGASSVASRPYLLDEVKQGFMRLWNVIRNTKGMTDARLRNVESLLMTKYDEWREDEGREEAFEAFADSVIRNNFGGNDLEFLKEAIRSGLFFDCLELYLSILKERIGDRGGH